LSQRARRFCNTTRRKPAQQTMPQRSGLPLPER